MYTIDIYRFTFLASIGISMQQKTICIAIIILITIVLLACTNRSSNADDSLSQLWDNLSRKLVTTDTTKEAFASKNTKAQMIYDWFKANPAPAYIDYKHHMGLRSNIVEYEDVLNLMHSGKLSVASVAAII